MLHDTSLLALAAPCLILAASTVRADSLEAKDEPLRQEVEQLRTTVDDLREQVRMSNQLAETLQQQVSRLQEEAGEDWLTDARAAEIRGLVQEVLADADTRSGLLDNGVTAGWDNGFYLASADGAFRLNIGGQVQVRYLANFRHGSGSDDFEGGFQLRRAKVWMYGTIGHPTIGYKLQLAANRNSGSVELEEGYAQWSATDDLKLVGGRYTGPLLRDQFTSNSRQLAVERSTVAYVFVANDNYVDGVLADWRAADVLQVRAGLTDGIGSGNPGGSGNDFANDATDFAASVRLDFRLAGEWSQMRDFASWKGEGLAAFLGGAVHYELAESGDGQGSGMTPVTGPYDKFVLGTLDGMVKYEGFNLLVEGVIQYINATKDNTSPGNMTNFGIVAQGGYMVIPDAFEPYARYEFINIDNDSPNLNLVTAGFNYYIKKHTTKFTVDALWALDPVTADNTLGAGLNGQGLLYDAPGQDNQVVLRAQFQMLF